VSATDGPGNIEVRIELLKESIQYGEQLYEYCRVNGYEKYLREMWTRCEGRNGRFDYLKRTKAQLRDLLKDQKEMKKREAAVKKTSDKIIKLVRENPGIFQKNLPDLLPDIDKWVMRDALDSLIKNNHVIREKRSRGYVLLPSNER
jgi:predicted HTH transcriptional regulator